MKIQRKSPHTGQINEMDLPITDSQWAEWNLPAHERRNIQEIFPNLTSDQREFIMTGLTAEDWDAWFREEEDDD